MSESCVEILTAGDEAVLTPHGIFRIANRQSISPGKRHVIRYHPADQFAKVIAVSV